MGIPETDRLDRQVVPFAEKWSSQNFTVSCVMKKFSLTVVPNSSEYQKKLGIIHELRLDIASELNV